MSFSKIPNLKINGMACAVPTKKVSINDFSQFFDENEMRKFKENVGVEESYCVNRNQTASDLCFVAAEKIISEKNIPRESIDGLVFITQSADYLKPATACILQTRLNLPKDCMAFDINLGCSGFVYALQIVGSMINGGGLNRVLVLMGDAHNSLYPDSDSMSVLHGDGGAAFILEKGTSTVQTLLKTDGSGYKAILTPGLTSRIWIDESNFSMEKVQVTMDGVQVFEFTFREVPKIFKEFFKLTDTSINDFDYCVLHQANLSMLKHIQKKLKLPEEKMPLSIDRYGNTSSASIPMTIVDLVEREKTPERMKIISSGFGVGLSWGIATFEIDRADIYPMIFTDDYFKEAFLGD